MLCLLLFALLCTEPSDSQLLAQWVDASAGLHFREYLLDGHWYRTARLLAVDADLDPTAIASYAAPTFYWQDTDGDGEYACDEMWIREGGQIRPYGCP